MKKHRQGSLVRQLYFLFGETILLITAALLILYSVSFQIIRDRESQYMYSAVEQVTRKADDIADAVNLMAEIVSKSPAAKNLLSASDSTKQWEYKQSLTAIVVEMAKSNPNVSSILLIDNDGSVFGFSGIDYQLASKLNAKYDIFSNQAAYDGFSGALFLGSDPTSYYVCCKPIYWDIDKEQRLGSCMIFCNGDALTAACEDFALSENALLAILDRSGQLLACNREMNAQLEEGLRQQLASHTENQFSAYIQTQRYLIVQYPALPLVDWKVIGAIPYAEIYSGLQQFQLVALSFVVILAFSLFVVIRKTISGITRPLLNIAGFIENTPDYVLHNRLAVDTENEIASIGTGINSMLDKIGELNHQVLSNQSKLYEIQLANNQAHLLALQSQINPHFINNTLNAVQGMAYQQRYESICTATAALGSIMRYSISGENYVTVDEELHCVEQYLRIIRLRFPKRFTIALEIDEAIRSCVMPRFLLQPLIENAVFHGLEPRSGGGTLTFSGCLLEGTILHFTCTDDGVGMTPEKLTALQNLLRNATQSTAGEGQPKGAGIGLHNIQQRLQLIYGADYGLTISSTPNAGTTVAVDFPAFADSLGE